MISLARFRGRYFGVFACAAFVLPSTSVLALQSGWSPQLTGTAVAAMTVSGALAAPLWGLLDDRDIGRVLPLAALVAGGSAGGLCVAAINEFLPPVVVPLLIVFGAASGGLEGLLSARVQRSGVTHALPRLRGYGSLGWAAGLATASLLDWFGFGVFVYAGAALCCCAMVLLEVRDPIVSVARDAATARRSALSLPILFYLLAGLPVPISAYGYLLYSSTVLDALSGLVHAIPLLTLLVLAVIELPLFAVLSPILPGRSVPAIYLAALGLLAVSWVPFVLPMNDGFRLVALVPYTVAVVLWSVAQPVMVRAFAPNRSAAVAQTLASSLTKGAAAVVSGAGIGAFAGVFGIHTVPYVLLGITGVGLMLALISVSPGSKFRYVTVPSAAT